jgi:hypothetical protein
MRLFFVLLIVLFQNQPQAPHAQKETQHPNNGESRSAQVSSVSASVGRSDKETPAHQAEDANAYDPRKDCLYRWYMRATIFGVLGGFIGIGLLIWQSTLLRHSVNAAHKGADALMDSEGAVLKIDEGAYGRDGGKSYVGHRLHNIGRTIATIITGEQAVQLGPSADHPPNPALYEETGISIPADFYVPAGEHTGITNYLTDRSGLTGKAAMGTVEQPIRARVITDEEWEELTKRTKTLWSYGFVRYRDVFKRVYELRYCQRFEPNMAKPPNFMVAGPSEFNRLTRYTEKKR